MGSPQHNFCHTELGIGEHAKDEERLQLERQREFQDHITEASNLATPNSNRKIHDAQTLENQISSSSAACIGWFQSDDYAERKRRLNLERKAEYEAHLAMKERQKEDTRNERKPPQEQKEEEQIIEEDIRHQKQQKYAQQLHDQIEEKRRLDSERKLREKHEDEAYN